MLIKDSEQFLKTLVSAQFEAQDAKLRQWEEESVANSILVKDGDLNAGNAAYQMGKAYTNFEFEAKLQKLNPNFRFNTFKNKEGQPARGIWLLTPEGMKSIMGYGVGLIPENSIRRVYYKDIREKGVKKIHIDRSEIKADWDNENKEFKFDTSKPMPGFRRVWLADRELVRGWRTVLLRLMQEGYLKLTDVEREFGISDRQTWAYGTGKAGADKPW